MQRQQPSGRHHLIARHSAGQRSVHSVVQGMHAAQAGARLTQGLRHLPPLRTLRWRPWAPATAGQPVSERILPAEGLLRRQVLQVRHPQHAQHTCMVSSLLASTSSVSRSTLTTPASMQEQ